MLARTTNFEIAMGLFSERRVSRIFPSMTTGDISFRPSINPHTRQSTILT